MKNFFKKLSFVLASAMVITSLYAPANAKAASNFVRVKGSNKAVTSKDLFVGGKKVNFDYTIGKKKTGLTGKWTSSDTSVVTVDAKTGVAKAVANGSATLTFKSKKTKAVKKSYTVKVTVNAFTRAKAVEVAPTSAAVKVGETVDLMATLKAIDKAGSSESTYNVVAMSSDEQVASVAVDGKKITVTGKMASPTPATISVFARHKDGDKYDTAKVEVPVTVKAALGVKQTAANKLTVMGSELATDAAMYVIKNDKGVALALKKDVKANDAKTEVTLESDLLQIIPGKYTLSYNKGEEVPFEVVKAVVKEAKILPEDKAILDSVETKAYVNYKLFDQFGNDITSSVYSSKLQVTSSIDSNPTVSDGKITMSNGTTAFRPLVDKISVTLVEKNTGVNATAILTVGEKAKVWDAEYVGVYHVDDKKMVTNISEADKTKKFKILFTLKDQYGNAYEEKTDIKKQLNVTTVGLGNITVKNQDGAVVPVDKKKYMGYDLNVDNLRQGEVMVNAIGLNNGKMVSGKFDVLPATKVNEISVQEGPMGVYNGQKNELSYTATDINGKPVTDYKTLSNSDALYKITMTPAGKLSWENKDGKAVLVYDLTRTGTDADVKDVVGNDQGTQTQILTFLTATNKFSTVNINVNNTRKPVAFLGLKSDVVTGLTQVANKALEIKMKNLRFQDQYGREMSAKDVAKIHDGKYGLVIKKTEDAVFTYDITKNTKLTGEDDKVVVNATVKKLDGSATAEVSFQLGYAAAAAAATTFAIDNEKYGAEKKVTLSSVALNDLKNLMIGDVKTQPASDLYAAPNSNARYYNLRPEVFGYYDGNKIKLDDSLYVVFAGMAKNAVDVNAVGEYLVRVPEKKTITSGDSAKAKFTVIVQNKDVTRLEKEYTYSKETPKVASAKFTGEDNKFTVSDAVDWTALKAKFEVKDQYGKSTLDHASVAPYVTFSAEKEVVDQLVDKNFKNNGSLGASFELAATGEYAIKVTLTFPGSDYKYEGTIKFIK